jgi:Effector-associated domain 1
MAPLYIEKLCRALRTAFPKRDELAQFIRLKLDNNLEEIAADKNLTETVFELVRWMESQGRLGELVAAAKGARPLNKDVAALEEPIGPAPQARSRSGRSDVVSRGASPNIKYFYGAYLSISYLLVAYFWWHSWAAPPWLLVVWGFSGAIAVGCAVYGQAVLPRIGTPLAVVLATIPGIILAFVATACADAAGVKDAPLPNSVHSHHAVIGISIWQQSSSGRREKWKHDLSLFFRFVMTICFFIWLVMLALLGRLTTAPTAAQDVMLTTWLGVGIFIPQFLLVDYGQHGHDDGRSSDNS